MAFFGKKSDDDKKKSTEEQIDEAKKDIKAKGDDSQTEKDRIDESVAAQERAEGDEDKQDAKDRVTRARELNELMRRKRKSARTSPTRTRTASVLTALSRSLTA